MKFNGRGKLVQFSKVEMIIYNENPATRNIDI
jgi:hypothetical protein